MDPPDTTSLPEESLEVTQAPRKERSQAQILALENARTKAAQARAQASDLRKKEREVQQHKEKTIKEARMKQINDDYERLRLDRQPAEGPKEPPSPPPEQPNKKRKPARRIIVTEASSATDSEEEVEVMLPKSKKREPTPEEARYQRTFNKMFTI